MKSKKLRVKWKPDPIGEAKTLGYMEGYSDSYNNLLKKLIKFKLLKSGWEKKLKKCHVLT